MIGLIEFLNSKKVIIWGIGAIQRDMEVLFPQINIFGYIDDKVDEKRGRIPDVLPKNIYPLEYLDNCNKDSIMVIICEQEKGRIMNILNKKGYYENMNFILYDRLLYEYPVDAFIDRFLNSKVIVWGAGVSFDNYEEPIRKNTQGIEYIIDINLINEGEYKNYKSLPVKEGLLKRNSNPIIVASTFYPVIADQLKNEGLVPGKDFIYCDTFFMLCQYIHLYDSLDYRFIDRSKNSDHLLIVLAGYKEDLWSAVSSRIRAYVPNDYDICILSSGKTPMYLEDDCERYNWSFLCTKENKISIIQNLAIHLHRCAEWIVKMDEDIFLTENVMEIMEKTYEEAQKKSFYTVGFVSPLINVNTYGYSVALKKSNLSDRWSQKFGTHKITTGISHHTHITDDIKAAEFIWDEIDFDEYTKKNGNTILYSVCPARYSIGIIYFNRETWIDMKLFPDGYGNNLGMDEEHFCFYCMMHGKAMVIAESAMVGHWGYREQKRVYYAK